MSAVGFRLGCSETNRYTKTENALTDAQAFTKEDLAELYGFPWNVELDIRAIKQTLSLDHLRCKRPEMVRRELWVPLLACNLIRKVIVTSAAIHGTQPRRLGFTLACQTVLASWVLFVHGVLLQLASDAHPHIDAHRRL